MKTPKDLVKEAKKEKLIYNGPFVSDYAEVIYELRKKNFSWDAIMKWFLARKLNFSFTQIISSYRRTKFWEMEWNDETA
jgi:hypothetical protein